MQRDSNDLQEPIMKNRRFRSIAILTMAVSLSAACSRAEEGDVTASPTAIAALPAMIVHKSEGCGCCEAWITLVRLAGYPVEVRNESNLNPIKERLGVPAGKGSCHTAEIDGYMIEGHVPVADIQKLLKERPDARGLVVAGMPAGSPGMESPDGSAEAYVVELVARDGTTRPFSAYAAKPTAGSAPAPQTR
jgi:hypothetical protein